tara:strand:- start:34553 stop:35191 length:639 start_codon:yes stop_codon:yes gene_type:complete
MTGGGNINDALAFITAQDPDFARALPLIKPLPDRGRPAGFEHLSKIIVEQQVSLASAEAIWKRLSEAVAPFTPEMMVTFDEDGLRSLGLSRQKARYCRALAMDIVEGRLLLDRLHEEEDAAVLEQLTQVKGIGRWTAEIYMIACLGRADVWPAGDIALQNALGHLKNLPQRPDAKAMDLLGEPLRPHRTLAARILWRYYADVVQAATRKSGK